LEADEVWSFVFCSHTKVWLWIVLIAAKKPVKYSGIAFHRLIKRPWFLRIIGRHIQQLFPRNNIAPWVKKPEKRPILNVGIIRYGSI